MITEFSLNKNICYSYENRKEKYFRIQEYRSMIRIRQLVHSFSSMCQIEIFIIHAKIEKSKRTIQEIIRIIRRDIDEHSCSNM